MGAIDVVRRLPGISWTAELRDARMQCTADRAGGR